MNRYLANIAARSTRNDTQSLIPTTPAPAVFDEGSTLAEKDNFQQDEFIQQNLTPDEPYRIQPVITSEINDKMETPLAEKSIEISYFSRHTERLNSSEAGNALQNNLLETEGIKFEEPLKKITTVPERVNLNENEPAFINKTGLDTLADKKRGNKLKVNKTTKKPGEPAKPYEPANPSERKELKRSIVEQKQFIAPSNEEIKRANKSIPNKADVERIIPNLSGNENNGVIQNTKKPATPKLVIGKISVEILPPIANVPPKVITKVVPSNSKPDKSKSNKLIFGLGQM